MAEKKRRRGSTEHVDAYFIRTNGVEIGPFRSREAAVAEAKAIRQSDPNVKIARRAVEKSAFDAPTVEKKKGSSKPDDDLFDDDEEEEDDDDLDDLFDDDDEEDEEEDEEEDDDDDDPPSVTHPFFRPIGKKG